jgi:hypothetical protein
MRSPGPGIRRRRRAAGDAAVAGGIAAIVSGAPSTAYAVARGRDPLEAALAAGTLLLPRERRPALLLPAATIVHLTLSIGWASVLSRVLPRRHAAASATAAGLAIAALDLGVVGRRFPAIRALPLAPQIADHIAYAWTVAAVLHRRKVQR